MYNRSEELNLTTLIAASAANAAAEQRIEVYRRYDDQADFGFNGNSTGTPAIKP